MAGMKAVNLGAWMVAETAAVWVEGLVDKKEKMMVGLMACEMAVMKAVDLVERMAAYWAALKDVT